MSEYKCQYCDFTTDNPRVLANHVRWKHIMPKGSEEQKAFSSKMINIASEKNPLITKTCVCQKCGKEFEQTLKEKEWLRLKKIKRFCSVSCANSRERPQELRTLLRKKIADSLGKNESELKTQKRICPVCGKEFVGINNTCSRKCGRILYEQNKPEKDLSDYYNYRKECEFSFNLSDFPNEFDFNLIEENGWYSPSNSSKPNLYGVSRDHMLSVKYGWENKIDPKIIKHPANCKLVLQSDNVSKGTDCSITYDELIERIKEWDSKYK